MDQFDEVPGLAAYQRITSQCTRCKGTGTVWVKSEDGTRLDDCTCIHERLIEYRLDRANVQGRYRNFTLDKLTDEFREINADSLRLIQEFLDDMYSAIRSGSGLYLQGDWGAAKSAISAVIVREACRRGYPSYMTRFSRLIHLYMDGMRSDEAREHVEWVLGPDIELLVLEEIDKVQIDPKGGPADRLRYEAFQEVIGQVYDSRRAFIVTSNLPLRSISVDEGGEKPVVYGGLETLFHDEISGHLIDRLDALTPVVLEVKQSFRSKERWR